MKTLPTKQNHEAELKAVLNAFEERIEETTPELHKAKNTLNFIGMELEKVKNIAGKHPQLKPQISKLLNEIADCQTELSNIYGALNQNPAKKMGLRSALRIFCNNLNRTVKTQLEVDYLNLLDEVMDWAAQGGIYQVCTAAIELACLKNSESVYALLMFKEKHLELRIDMNGIAAEPENKEVFEKKKQYLIGLLIWKNASILPETNWQDVIHFAFNFPELE